MKERSTGCVENNKSSRGNVHLIWIKTKFLKVVEGIFSSTARRVDIIQIIFYLPPG